ncbi:MAG: MerR family transcriptional regulator [Myxococcota bacterium]
MSSSSTHRMKVGELARKTGKTVRALRLYEERGLLTPARSEGNFRLYGPDEVARVYWITKLQDLGFSLPQIQRLLQTVETSTTGPDAMQSLRQSFRARLDDTRAQVEKLLQLERDLAESLAYLEGCRACSEDHSVEGCVRCGGVHADTKTPSLVAGVHSSSAGRDEIVRIRNLPDSKTPVSAQ